MALQIVQYVAEIKKPDGERLAQFHDAGLDSLKFQLLSPAPIYTATEKLFMTTALKLGEEKLGKDDAFVQAILQGGEVDATVNALVDGTKLADPACPQIAAGWRRGSRGRFHRSDDCGRAPRGPHCARDQPPHRATPSTACSPRPAKSWARRASWSMARTPIPTPPSRCA